MLPFATPPGNKFVSLDLETTHLDAREGRIIEVGAVEVELVLERQTDGELKLAVTFGKSFSSLVNPEIEVPAAALALTGIKAEELSAAPRWSEVRAQLKDFLGEKILIGHNLAFDLGFLQAQGLRLKNEYIDTLEAAQTLLPLLPSHSLESLGEAFGMAHGTAHRALADSKTAARLLAVILNEFSQYPQDLQQAIKGWLQRSKIRFREVVLQL